MKTRKSVSILLFLFVITACAPKTAAPEDTEIFSTPAISAENMVEIQCPLNNQFSPETASRLPRVYSNGMCGLHFAPGVDNTLVGVFLGYPAGWSITPVGEDGTALILDLEPRVIYFQAFQSDLPLEEADQVTYSAEPGISEPAISQEEIIKDKSLQTIGDKDVMILTTTMSEQTIWRAFLSQTASGKSKTLFMFQLTVLAPDMDNSQLIGFVETLINNMSFDQ